MPHPDVERLSKGSADAQMKAAMSSCIASEMKKGTPQDQAVAMCASMVREKMGAERMPAPGGEKK